MSYRFATESQDYTDYASGGVFYNAPGHPAFPVRLTSEIFQRCESVRAAAGATGRPVLYDPVCGAAYHLSTLAYLHWNRIGEILASDVDAEILATAERNLSLLTVAGLERRIREIEEMLATYGKSSHAAALESAHRLRQRLLAFTQDHEIPTRVFQADATDAAALRSDLAGTRVDIVISDIPYGQHSAWRSADPAGPAPVRPIWRMLEALRPHLSAGAVVAIAADKAQKIEHEAYRRATRFQVGKRQVVLLQVDAG
jgi:23S rRNA (guanine2535-N1)-methyltransferase